MNCLILIKKLFYKFENKKNVEDKLFEKVRAKNTDRLDYFDLF